MKTSHMFQVLHVERWDTWIPSKLLYQVNLNLLNKSHATDRNSFGRYYGNQQLTEKSDVYSFGVVLLELISGRRPISVEDYGSECNIVHWVRYFLVLAIIFFIVGNIQDVYMINCSVIDEFTLHENKVQVISIYYYTTQTPMRLTT